MIIAKMIIPKKRGASNSMRNTIMAIIIMRAIIPIIIAPIVPPIPKMIISSFWLILHKILIDLELDNDELT